MDLSDTIAAIATAPGRGGVAVIRVSGLDAFAIGKSLTGKTPAPRRVTFAAFRDRDGKKIDDGLLLAFRAPNSYTGEDVVELQCHGGTVCPRRVLEACLAAGARLARRGEFTERAFLNGKIDIEGAEAVLNLIDAKTDRAADDALSGFAGARKAEIRALYDAAVALSATVEHSLDVDESDLPESFFAALDSGLLALQNEVASAIARARAGKLRRDGALVVLAGPPNVGKSSLMNALLGENRAIVSATPGTTRDTIEEWIDLEGWPVRLVDTAGLRESSDAIETEGVERAKRLIEEADLVLALCDSSAPAVAPASAPAAPEERGTFAAPDDCSTFAAPASAPVALENRGTFAAPAAAPASAPAAPSRILVHSKCDLSRGEGINVSAVTGEGIAALRGRIAASLAALAQSPDGAATASSASASASERDRVLAVLIEASACLRAAAADRGDLVLFANAIRRVSETLGAFLGAVYSEDLLDRLFSRFCVGK